ncbi:MAG: PD40 domain-containing protein, partial [Acidobacteriia bacterium]|nr:PD40 domain-containing protein [Terriglobia bacterium]
MASFLRVALPVAAAVFVVAQPLQANRGVTPEDYFAFQFINGATLSPDGKQAAYVRTVINQAKNRRDSSIWLVATDGRSSPRRLTADGFSSTAPRWSPDGSSLAFLSTRAETAGAEPSGEASRRQIWILTMNGGEAQVASHLKNGVEAFQWS